TQVRQQADDQRDLRTDTAILLKQLSELKDKLPAEQQERLKRAEEAAQKSKVLEDMAKAAELLDSKQNPLLRREQATELQRKAAAELQELARELRQPKDRL